MHEKTANLGITGQLLVHVGVIPVRLEGLFPDVIRRNFGARIFALAVISIVGAPVLALLLFESALPAVILVAGVTTVTGFLGYCEMYRSLRAINANINRVDNGEFEVSFEGDRIDEIGETYTALEETAA
jgi:methyl-accepting chemotaxis protein